MYEIEVSTEFCAAHALSIAGEREAVHGHNFRVTATVAGEALDADDLLCDFHAVERALEEIVRPWRNADLRALPALEGGNASAERIARVIAEALASPGRLPRGAHVAAVRVTEAPGCAATYRPPMRHG